MASDSICIPTASHFTSPAWPPLLNSRRGFSAACLTLPRGRRTRQDRLGYASLMMTWSLGGLSLLLAGARPAPSHHRSRTRRDGAAPAWATADHSAKGNRTWQTADWPSKRRLTLHRPNRALRSSPTSMTWGKTEPSRAASRPLRGAQWTSSPHLVPAWTPPHAALPLSPSPSRLLPAQSFYLLSLNVLE